MKLAPSLSPQERGFTLIELVVAVAIVGILAAIAYPSYTQYIRRGKIAEALGELTTLRTKLEQYYQDNRNYGSSASSCGSTMPATPSFSFTCSWGADNTAQSFVATATGLASAGMGGYVYTIDDANGQKTAQFEGASVNAGCWMKKRSDAC